MWRNKLAELINKITLGVHRLLTPFVPEDVLSEVKFIHLCWWFIKHNLPIPKYFIGSSSAPTVTDSAATAVKKYKATGNGNVTSDGGATITARGFVYSVTSVNNNPTIGGTGVTTTTVSGTTGAFSGDLGPSGNPNLDPNVGYSYKAYATNSKGTSYGSVQTFTTNTASSVALNTPSDTATNQSTTPDLVFTGTDSDSLDLEYNVQVDTAVTFDSGTAGGTTSYYFDAHIAGPTDPNNVWSNDSAAFGSTPSTTTATTTTGDASTNYLEGKGTNAPSTGGDITQVRARVNGYLFAGSTSLTGTIYLSDGTLLGTATLTTTGSFTWGSYVTLSTPSGGWTWTKANALYVRFFKVGGAGTNTYAGQAQIEVTYSALPILSKLSATPDATFTDVTNGADTHPFASGDQIKYTVQAGDTLANNTTYYWRARGKDPSGSNTYGAWATTRSFTTTAGETTTTIQKTLAYKVLSTPSALTKTLKYTVPYNPSAITKTLAYSVVRPSPIIQAVHMGSLSIDYTSLTQTEINDAIDALVTAVPHLTHVAIGTYLDYPTQISRWATAIHNAGKKMILRSAGFNDWQGTNGIPLYIDQTSYIRNAYFESNTDYWATGGGMSISKDTTEHYQGSASMKLLASTVDDRTWATFSDAGTPTVGHTYTFSVYLKGSGTVRLWVYDGSADQYSSDITLTGTWTKYSLQVTCAGSGMLAGIRLPSSNSVTAYADQVYWVDDATSPDTFTNNSKDKFVSWVNSNYSVFASGDWFTPVPDEPENCPNWTTIYGGLGTDTGANAYNSFIQDSIAAVKTALSNNSVTGVEVGFVDTNPSASKDVISVYTDSKLVQMGTDDYPESSDTTPSEMETSMQDEIDTWVSGSHGGKPKHVTFGPSIYTQLSEADQADALGREFDVIANTLGGTLKGITVWQFGNQANDPKSRLFDYSGGTWTARSAASTLNSKFASLAGAIRLNLTYKVKTSPTVTKSLKYTVITTPSTVTKSLTYRVVTNSTIQKTLVYKVKPSPTVTKSLKYTVLSAQSVTKSLKYTVIITPSAITKSLTYEIHAVSTQTITKDLTYRVVTASTVTKSLKYTVKAPVTITKSLKYTVQTSQSLTKSLSYRVVVPSTLTKQLGYYILTSSTITKSLRYALRPSPTITKSLIYKVKAPVTITKSLKYTVPSSSTINKSLKYCVVTTQPTWDVRYEALELPEDATPAWNKNLYNGNQVVKDGILNLNNSGGGDNDVFYYIADSNLDGKGTMEFRLRVNSGGVFEDGNSVYNYLYANSSYFQAFVDSEKIVIQSDDGGGGNTTYITQYLDTSVFHTYRVTVDGTEITLYIDGVLIDSATTPVSVGASQNVSFAVYDATPSSYDFDYFYYRTDGAFAPAGLTTGKSLTYYVVLTNNLTKSLTYQVLSSPSVTKSLKYTIISAQAVTKSLKYAVLTNPSATTKQLRYFVRTSATIQKSLTYEVESVVTTRTITRSLKYSVITSPSITKTLIYKVTSPLTIAKSLKYTITVTPATIQKSLKYAVTVPATITKLLTYKVFVSQSVTKSLTYKVVAPVTIAKSLKYTILKSGTITKSLKYTVIYSISITKSLRYDIFLGTFSITKSLTYRVSTETAITKSLKYALLTNATIQKSLTYAITGQSITVTKSLKYTVVSPVTIQKSLTYRVYISYAIQKTLTYRVLKAGTITKSLRYDIFLGVSTITKSLSYRVFLTHTVTKNLQYFVRLSPSITKSLKYTVTNSPVITKSLTYVLEAQARTIQKTLRYAVSIPRTITKTLQYRVNRSLTLTKSLTYSVRVSNSLTKQLIYTVRSSVTITKQLKYVLEAVSITIQKQLVYEVRRNLTITKSLTYKIGKAITIQKSLKYVVPSPKTITKTLKYSVRTSGTITKSLIYSMFLGVYIPFDPLYLNIGGGLSIPLDDWNLPRWNTEGRPASATTGTIGYNFELDQLEIYTTSGWKKLSLIDL